ncbi:MAG TPA: hypothetical protein ENH99_02595 [Candidatus Pacearchaeota archaeon]|nr:hypothetical protein [Candidatus Pacearchaeota archaeon]
MPEICKGYAVLYKTAEGRNYALVCALTRKRIKSLLVSKLEEENPGIGDSLDVLGTIRTGNTEKEESVEIK